jgi:cytochrome P450
MSHAALVEVTKRHVDFCSGEGIVMESLPQELLDIGQGFIALDPPRHTKVRRLLTAAFTPKQIRRINDQIRANAPAAPCLRLAPNTVGHRRWS